jgi:hypothetical protein
VIAQTESALSGPRRSRQENGYHKGGGGSGGTDWDAGSLYRLPCVRARDGQIETGVRTRPPLELAPSRRADRPSKTSRYKRRIYCSWNSSRVSKETLASFGLRSTAINNKSGSLEEVAAMVLPTEIRYDLNLNLLIDGDWFAAIIAVLFVSIAARGQTSFCLRQWRLLQRGTAQGRVFFSTHDNETSKPLIALIPPDIEVSPSWRKGRR